jgi:allophanate hydrolase
MTVPDLSIGTLHEQYRSGETTPSAVIETVLDRVEPDERNVWISRVPAADLRERARELDAQLAAGDPVEEVPLFGVPFALKDNIDAVELPTTAGCPAYAYEPTADATVVERLRAAGAVFVGKTNMDQFATGLVGTRTPYGTCRNAIDESYISGGSSAGSGVAVAAGQVSFALGTDTAGSGRVPAACNGIVGLKPTRGALSNAGVVPACRTLDCVAVFALTCPDALRVERVAAGFDSADPYSRPAVSTVEFSPGESVETVGVPAADQLTFFGDDEAATLFEEAVARFETLGVETRRIDFEPFLDAGRLLYGGPWVAERLVVVRDLLERDPDALVPVTREIISRGAEYSATDTFEAMYELERLRAETRPVFESVDCLVTPTTGTVPTIEAVERDPVERNSDLGEYTNFVNLLDLAAVAVPAGRRRSGIPFGITLLGTQFADAELATLGDRFCRAGDEPIGADATPYTAF